MLNYFIRSQNSLPDWFWRAKLNSDFILPRFHELNSVKKAAISCAANPAITGWTLIMFGYKLIIRCYSAKIDIMIYQIILKESFFETSKDNDMYYYFHMFTQSWIKAAHYLKTLWMHIRNHYKPLWCSLNHTNYTLILNNFSNYGR